MLKVTIYWNKTDRQFREAVHLKYPGIPVYMTLNGETEAFLTEEELTAIRRGEPKYLHIRRITQINTKNNVISEGVQPRKTSKV